ncbi:hypothetical protein [Actinomadura macrotermitis]|uniref:Uncharacterized protein n=1 Tax=Actinomadura macrotermitis TaxID=2585200 RepID=A0A7K0BP15_9ACTN|nr:hypothetical protein [Actinomadura macrotermitis]MQY02816.1 hypothetical protein [Actinomadura macrotermitis]
MRVFAVAACLAALTACGSTAFEAGRQCTMMAGVRGVNVGIEPPYAARVATAAMQVCWGTTCRASEVELLPSTDSVPQPCKGEVCSAQMTPTGGKTGLAQIGDLPQAPIAITLTLKDKAGKRLLRQKVATTAKMSEPNGPGCGGGAPYAGVTVRDGKVTAQ